MLALVMAHGELRSAIERALAPHDLAARTADTPGEAAAVVRDGGCALVVVDADAAADAAAGCLATLVQADEARRATLIAISRDPSPARMAELLSAGAHDVLRLPEESARLAARASWAVQRSTDGAAAADLPYRAVFERNPLAMAILEEETMAFLAVSDGAERAYGWSREEFLRMTLHEVRPPALVPALDDALARSDPSFLCTTHRRKDGSEFTSQGILQRLAVGGRRLRFAVSRDATEELRAEAAHQRLLAEYRALVDRSGDGIFIHRHDYSIAYANPAFVAFLGHPSPAAIVGSNVLDFVHPDDRETVRGRIEHIISSGQSSPPRTIRFVAPDGSVRWAETRGISVTYENEPVVTVMARDLTDRRQAEEALRRSEERFARIFHASPAGVSITRISDGRFLDVNERFVQTMGYRRDEVVGRTGDELGLWHDPAQRQRLYEVARQTGSARDLEVCLVKKSGERIDALMSTDIVEIGGERCVLTLAHDISEHKRLEAQLRQSHKMEAIGRLAGGIAHDFNNLLTGIRGYSELVIAEEAAGSSARLAAEHIQRAALRAARLASQLLVFTSRQSRQTRVLALDDVVAEMASLLRRIIGGDIRLELRLGAADGRVRADPSQLEQVLLNLAVNARDAMPRGGRLSIATSDERDAATGRRLVGLHVGDDGCGMTDEVRTRIFEPFFTTKEVGKGTGLGLSIVYGIVDQSGGSISCDSAVGRGSTFHVRLPWVDEPKDVEAVLAPPITRAPAAHELILLVEDDEDVREFVQFVLLRAGYRVLAAEDGVVALEVAAAHEGAIDLLLSDVVMPRMGGCELATELARRRPSIKVCHMSGFPGPKGPLTVDGEWSFLQKPFSADELLRRVRAALDPRQRERAGT